MIKYSEYNKIKNCYALLYITTEDGRIITTNVSVISDDWVITNFVQFRVNPEF